MHTCIQFYAKYSRNVLSRTWKLWNIELVKAKYDDQVLCFYGVKLLFLRLGVVFQDMV